MSTSRPFAYNTGSPIAGTQQLGSIAYGVPSGGYDGTGLDWWEGPDEELGYVIAYTVPSGTQPTPDFANDGFLGFFRSSALTEQSFVDLADVIAGPSGGGPFASANNAKSWLNSNGYWTSFGAGTGGTGFGFNLVELPYNYPSDGNSILNQTPPTMLGGQNPNELANNQRGFFFNMIDNTGTDRSSYYSSFLGQNVTITLSQNGNSAVYTGNTGAFKQWISGGATGYVFGTNVGVPPSGIAGGTATLVQASPSPFSFGSPVYVTISLT